MFIPWGNLSINCAHHLCGAVPCGKNEGVAGVCWGCSGLRRGGNDRGNAGWGGNVKGNDGENERINDGEN